MKARPAALVLALMVAGMTFLGPFLSSQQGRLLAQEPQPGAASPPPEPTPTPAPTPTPTPARPPAAPAPKPVTGIAPIDQVYPLDYKSVVDRLAQEPNNP